MSCDRWIPLLMLAADERLQVVDQDDRAGLERHLAGCDACREALAVQRTVADAIRTRQDAPVPDGFADRLVARLGRSGGWIDALRWRTWSYRLAPVAAGLLLLAFIAQAERSAPVAATSQVELAEVWAFGLEASGAVPAYALLGQGNVEGELLLDVILSTEPDEPLVESGIS